MNNNTSNPIKFLLWNRDFTQMAALENKKNACKPVIKHIVTISSPVQFTRTGCAYHRYFPFLDQAKAKRNGKKVFFCGQGKGRPRRNLFAFPSERSRRKIAWGRWRRRKRFNNKINVWGEGKFLVDFLFYIIRFPPIFHKMGFNNKISLFMY